MTATKQMLARSIEAYASARASGNPDLQTFAAHQLSNLIENLGLPDDTTVEPAPTPAVDPEVVSDS